MSKRSLLGGPLHKGAQAEALAQLLLSCGPCRTLVKGRELRRLSSTRLRHGDPRTRCPAFPFCRFRRFCLSSTTKSPRTAQDGPLQKIQQRVVGFVDAVDSLPDLLGDFDQLQVSSRPACLGLADTGRVRRTNYEPFYRASSKAKVKPTDLNFSKTASPNSRLLALSLEDPPSVARTASSGSARSSKSTPSSPSHRSSAPISLSSSNGRIGANGTTSGGPNGSKASKAADSASASESDSAEEETATPVRKASVASTTPVNKSRAGSASSTPLQRGSSSAKSTGKSPAIAPRTASPESGSESESEESESEESEESEEDDEYAHSPVGKNAAALPEKGGKKAQRSKAATLAAEAMDAPMQARGKKNKALATLTYDDVKLSDADLKEDIAIVWKAMCVLHSSTREST